MNANQEQNQKIEVSAKEIANSFISDLSFFVS
jgi:hypothetical protein